MLRAFFTRAPRSFFIQDQKKKGGRRRKRSYNNVHKKKKKKKKKKKLGINARREECSSHWPLHIISFVLKHLRPCVHGQRVLASLQFFFNSSSFFRRCIYMYICFYLFVGSLLAKFFGQFFTRALMARAHGQGLSGPRSSLLIHDQYIQYSIVYIMLLAVARQKSPHHRINRHNTDARDARNRFGYTCVCMARILHSLLHKF